MPPAAYDRQHELARLDRLARVLDAKFRMPLFGFRFGWDGILGLIPGLGDLATTVPAALIIYRAHHLGLPRHVIARMVGNTAVDTVFGSVPLIGSVFDVYYKSNLRNIALIRRHLERPQPNNT